MSNALLHIADRIIGRPLLIHPDKLALITSILDGRIGIDATEFKDIDIDAAFREGKPEGSRFSGSRVSADGSRVKPYRVEGGVAIIPVIGSLVNRGAWLDSKSGMTSYEGLGYQLDTAAIDPDVKSVLLDVDSPGGEAIGAFEVADKVRSLAKVKHVTAVVNGMAASAAYAIASAATEIVSAPSAISGSIGVVLMHADYSNAMHQKGVRPTLIHAGAHKIDGNPYEPLTEAVRADLKAEVDNFYDLFVSGVAKGRKGKMTEKAIRGTEARTYIGQAALDAGLVDAIGSFQTVLADLSKKSKASKREVRSGIPSGLSLANGASPATTVRPDVERAAILEAGRKAGLEKCAAIFADQSPETTSTAFALEFIAKQATIQLESSRDRCGLFLGDANLAVHGGPLFSAPEQDRGAANSTADNHGWDEIIANMNKKLN